MLAVTGKSAAGHRAHGMEGGCCHVASLMDERVSWWELARASSCPQRSPIHRLTHLCFICLMRTDEIMAQAGWLKHIKHVTAGDSSTI